LKEISNSSINLRRLHCYNCPNLIITKELHQKFNIPYNTTKYIIKLQKYYKHKFIKRLILKNTKIDYDTLTIIQKYL